MEGGERENEGREEGWREGRELKEGRRDGGREGGHLSQDNKCNYTDMHPETLGLTRKSIVKS